MSANTLGHVSVQYASYSQSREGRFGQQQVLAVWQDHAASAIPQGMLLGNLRQARARGSAAVAFFVLVAASPGCSLPEQRSHSSQVDAAPAEVSDAEPLMSRSAVSPKSVMWRDLFKTNDGFPRTPPRFCTAKNHVLQIHRDHRTTFYCGCKFGNDKSVSWKNCGFKPRNEHHRSHRMEWEHIVPIQAFGAYRPCWKEKLCTKPGGEMYSGPSCCGEIDPQYTKMEADLQNIVPVIGEVNAARRDFSFGEVPGESGRFGDCDFEADRKRKVAEPPDSLRGDIARVYLYMHHVYGDGLALTPAELRQFEAWHSEDPPSDWERERNRRIAKIQGGGNPLVK